MRIQHEPGTAATDVDNLMSETAVYHAVVLVWLSLESTLDTMGLLTFAIQFGVTPVNESVRKRSVVVANDLYTLPTS